MTTRLFKSAKTTLMGLMAAMMISSCAFAQPSQDVSAIPGGAYALDTRHASLIWKVSHLGFSDYVGRFNSFDAAFTYYPEAPEESTITATIDATSLDVNFPRFAEELIGEEWLDTGANDRISFSSTGITFNEDGKTADVTGDLTFHGVTHPVTMTVTFMAGGPHPFSGNFTIGFNAVTVIKRSDFGMTRSLPHIGDEVTITFDGEFNEVVDE